MPLVECRADSTTKQGEEEEDCDKVDEEIIVPIHLMRGSEGDHYVAREANNARDLSSPGYEFLHDRFCYRRVASGEVDGQIACVSESASVHCLSVSQSEQR